MKKFFVIAAMLLAGFSASAQINIGAGYMWDFWAQKNGSSKAGSRSMSGVYAGVSYNIQIVEGLGLAPGAYFSWATGIDLDKTLPVNGNDTDFAVGRIVAVDNALVDAACAVINRAGLLILNR